ncbi:hypothetical protein [Bdellovibrio sp. HCB-162]|uniref:hypothetical protein n=1 Tax=Bdellovibrio sp. HCB-162 TaxID=3394234 RepID=UPI0039BC31F2
MKTKKFLRTSKALTFFIVLSAIAALAAAGELLYESSGVSSFKLVKNPEGARTMTMTSQDYDVYRKYTQQGGEELFLVSSAKTVDQFLDAEGIAGNISWSVRKGPRLETVLWGKTEQATELNVHGSQPVVVSGLGGCCAEMTGYRLFDIESGRLLMSFNDFSYHEKVVQPFSLEVPNSDLRIRYIGVISQDSTRDRDFVAPDAGKEAAILIKYANEALKQKLQVDMDVAKGYAVSVMEVKLEKDPSVPGSGKIEIQDDQVRLWNIDGATSPSAISGVLLKIVLDGGKGTKTLKIPVKNDQFDLNSAQIPLGVSVHPIVQLRTL